ncbi:uncharacterized protein PITG_12134 [Phytophthora infestans T30-4]|uniref:Uncharacterized protein n=1 Tax=Phytophthora infestans (strain T30-4) TaxID=403677 RepID=D0NJ44_PHYIT|nr:uncharacterized protein PITG_12134 [Phytophthora infestans T30-4]EEY59562.1 hypothetical protein PITG_12134 [Phytophthora infestans T30-4]|eukprot:XP_002900755.1 hypothetical protein PITG_12134 [Phytophthora infestans T30-4]
MKYEHHRQISPGRRPPAARVVERICQLLHRKKDIAGAVWANYWDAEKRTAAPPPGNYVANQHSCPAMVAAFVQQFVRERRAIRQCTVARDVMDKLARNYVIHVDYDSSTAVVFALRPHGLFSSVYCENWMKKIIDVLGVYYIKTTIIVLDNAT